MTQMEELTGIIKDEGINRNTNLSILVSFKIILKGLANNVFILQKLKAAYTLVPLKLHMTPLLEIASIIFFFQIEVIAQTTQTINFNEFVESHNKYRSALNIKPITWSYEIMALAQNHAVYLANKGCTLNHSHREGYGENIAKSKNSTPANFVQIWAGEKSEYRGEAISDQNYRRFGHYTQMIWSKSKYFGCGIAKCPHGYYICVCNYSPPGKIVGDYPY